MYIRSKWLQQQQQPRNRYVSLASPLKGDYEDTVLIQSGILQKKSQESINARLALVMKSGKYTLGSKTCLKTLRSGKGKLQPDCFLEGMQPRFAYPKIPGTKLDQRCCTAAKLILISNNCPPIRKTEIEYYAMLSKTTVHHYGGSKFMLFFSAALVGCVLISHKPSLTAAMCNASLTPGIIGAVHVQQYSLSCVVNADNVDLGTACGKLHRVCTLAITDPGTVVCYAKITAQTVHVDAMLSFLMCCHWQCNTCTQCIMFHLHCLL